MKQFVSHDLTMPYALGNMLHLSMANRPTAAIYDAQSANLSRPAQSVSSAKFNGNFAGDWEKQGEFSD